MYVIAAEIVTKPGLADRYEALLRDVLAFVVQADCFIQFNVHRGGPRNETFMLYEIWTDSIAYRQLREHSSFQIYLRERERLIEPGVRRSDWTLVEAVSRSGKGHYGRPTA
jgi:quinol monooxygenase YgiN